MGCIWILWIQRLNFRCHIEQPPKNNITIIIIIITTFIIRQISLKGSNNINSLLIVRKQQDTYIELEQQLILPEDPLPVIFSQNLLQNYL